MLKTCRLTRETTLLCERTGPDNFCNIIQCEFSNLRGCNLCQMNRTNRKSKMAARTTEASGFSLSPDRTVFSCFLSCKTQCFCTYSSRLTVLKRAYSREFLLDVGRTTFLELNSAHAEELRDLGLLRRPTPSPTPLLHLAHSGGATSGVRGSRRG